MSEFLGLSVFVPWERDAVGGQPYLASNLYTVKVQGIPL